MIITTQAYPRAGLIGNPSDGYFGKAIAFAFTNFEARVTLYHTPRLEILPNTQDHSNFASIRHLAEDVKLYGYYGGIRLLKAAVRRFYEFCRERHLAIDDRNFTIQYHSDIPRMVGLGGSSAIITACIRALLAFYGLSIPRAELASLILSVETEELGISAGLQDRVAQVYQGLVYMDFERHHLQAHGYGRYDELSPALLPPLYIAVRSDLSEGSQIVHGDLRHRFRDGDADVLEAMSHWSELTDQVYALLREDRGTEIGPLLDANFDRRVEVCDVSDENVRMVQAARDAGASAKFTGSGGAIVGTYEDDDMYRRLVESLAGQNVTVLKPTVAAAGTGDST